MPPRKSRPVLFELVRREKSGDSGARVRQTTNGTSAATPQPPVEPVAPVAPRREVVGPPRMQRRMGSQTPLTGLVSRLGYPGIVAIGVGSVLAILLIVQAWLYLSRDAGPHTNTDGLNANQSTGAPATQSQSVPNSGRALQQPREPSPRESEIGTSPRGLLPTLGGSNQPNRSPSPEGNPPSGNAGNERPAPPADPRASAGNDARPPTPKESKPVTPAEPLAEAAQWDASLQKGKHYVVVAHYKKIDLPLAQAAIAFLQQRGVQCLVQESKNAYMVVATQPFLINQKDAAARKAQQARADEFKRKIKALGREHSRGSGNAFDQCYERLF